nr:McrC family protein [Phytoactinopolyspora mesophila]
MRRLRLTEHQPARAVSLSPEERDGLRAIKDFEVAPTPGTSGSFDLTPGSTVGAVEIGSLAVQISPKIPVGNVLFLISYALDPSRWRKTGFEFAERDSLLEAVIPGFVHQVRQAFRPGLLQGYRTQEESLSTVRGRIRIGDQIRRRHGISPPVEVRYDDFTEDIDVNRLIKAAIHRLSRLRIRSSTSRSALCSYDVALAQVTTMPYDARRLPEIQWTRLNQHYRPAVELASLILRATTFEHHDGSIRSTGFLVDMNQVFENFAVVALRDALGLREEEFPQGDKRLRLDLAHSVKLKPDLSWWEGGTCRFVGDLKYKRIGEHGIHHPDIYQLLSYVIAADLPSGLLIYAAGEADEAIHDIIHVGRRLVVTTLDVGGSPGEILGQVGALAGRISTLRSTTLV